MMAILNLRGWLHSYTQYLVKDRRVSLSTEQSYSRDLLDLLSYLEDNQILMPEDLKAHHLNHYLNHLRTLGRSTATITRRIVSIRSFCKYLAIQRALDYNPAIQLATPKVDKRVGRSIQASDMVRLLELPDVTRDLGVRDRAMLELIYATGLRVSELISLEEEQVRLDMGYLRCIEASGRERMVPLGAQGAAWVSKYVDSARPHLIQAEQPEAALFVNQSGVRLTRQGFWKIIKKYAEQLKLTITPQLLRQTFAAHMLDNGADIRAVQEMLGHTSPASTQIYQPKERLKLKEIYDRTHPRARS